MKGSERRLLRDEARLVLCPPNLGKPFWSQALFLAASSESRYAVVIRCSLSRDSVDPPSTASSSIR